jgi:hypothetical protein
MKIVKIGHLKASSMVQKGAQNRLKTSIFKYTTDATGTLLIGIIEPATGLSSTAR